MYTGTHQWGQTIHCSLAMIDGMLYYRCMEMQCITTDENKILDNNNSFSIFVMQLLMQVYEDGLSLLLVSISM